MLGFKLVIGAHEAPVSTLMYRKSEAATTANFVKSELAVMPFQFFEPAAGVTEFHVDPESTESMIAPSEADAINLVKPGEAVIPNQFEFPAESIVVQVKPLSKERISGPPNIAHANFVKSADEVNDRN